MKRAIDLDGVKPPTAAEKEKLGRPTYRSVDGSDLPARVQKAMIDYRYTYPTNVPSMVMLGRKELIELNNIIKKEWSSAAVRATLCGLKVISCIGEESHLEVA